jgi:hypothetical protein
VPETHGLDELGLVDHHCHGVLRRAVSRTEFEMTLTEGDWAGRVPGVSMFDSAIGFAVCRWCAPLLDLPAHTDPDVYLARRAELSPGEVARRFLAAAGIDELCVDTGFEPEPITSPAELGDLAGGPAHEIVRLERVAEEVAAAGSTAAGFGGEVRKRLAERCASAVGVKSIAAYRTGLALGGDRVPDAEVAAAAGRWLAAIDDGAPIRLADETLQRFLVWCGVELGLPVQFHVGYGDSDVSLERCDPLLLAPLLRAVAPSGVPIMLLHNYPYHRQAGYLAQVFPNVYVDAGLATHNLGRQAPRLISELLELAPFGKVLFSSDAFGLPELYYLGARLFRHGLAKFLDAGVADGEWTAADAARIARMLGAENARRVYGLDHT